MKTIITTILLLISQVLYAQTGVLMQRYYIAGSLSLGQNNRAFSDHSAWLQMGTDTTNRGVLFPKVLLDSVSTSARALYVYDLVDSVLYHFDGTQRVRYMTYKDTALVKQLIANNSPDLTPFVTKSDTARNGYAATYFYTDSLAAASVKYTDTAGYLPTKTFLTNNYFSKSGNSFGQTAKVGTKDSFRFELLTTDTSRMTLFANGNISIASSVDAGYKLDVNGTSRMAKLTTLNDGLFFENTNKGIAITSNAAAGNSMSIGGANTGYEQHNIKIGYSLKGSNNNKYYIVNTGFSNDASAANYYSTITGAYNTIANADAYTQVFGASNTVNFVPNGVAEGTSILGSNNQVLHRYCSIVGNNQVTTADNQLIFAQARSNGNACGFNDVYFGTGPRSTQLTKTGSNVTINASGAGADTNRQGGSLRLAAGRSTGTATPPDIIFATTTATSSGSSLQALTDRWYIKGETGRLSNNISPTAVLDVSSANGYGQLRMRTSYTPSSTADTNGHAGDICWDDNYLYIKTSAGWKRASLSSF